MAFIPPQLVCLAGHPKGRTVVGKNILAHVH